MANGAIYLPTKSVDLSRILKVIKTDRSLLRPPTFFEVKIGGDVVRFNIMPRHEIAGHLKGLIGYVNTLEETESRKQLVRAASQATQCILGLVTERSFQDNREIFPTLFKIAETFGKGFVFTHDSFFLPNQVVVGPMSRLATRSEPARP